MKKRTVSEWKELAAEYEASGILQKDWCTKKGINLYTFRDRLSKLRKTKHEADQIIAKEQKTRKVSSGIGKPTGIEWQEVSLNKISTAWQSNEKTNENNRQPKELESKIRVEVGHFTVVVHANFEETDFSKVCKVLVSLC